jgi:hypothetical protein
MSQTRSYKSLSFFNDSTDISNNEVYMNVLSSLFVLLFSLTAFANSPVGTFMIVKGDVSVVHSDGKTEKARIGLKVYPKDVIQTLKDARGKIVMVDKNVINLSPESKMQIQDYTFKPDENKKSVLLNLMYGKVRPQVNQKYDEKDNTFRVKTSAAVAGVRGTDFMVSFVNNQSQVVTFEGLVSVGSALELGGQIANPVSTTVAMNAAPAAPVPVPPAQLTNLDKDSNAEGKVTEPRQPAGDVPGNQPKEEKKEEPKEASNTRAPASTAPTGLPPPPPPPVNEVTVVSGPIAGLPPPNVPMIPLPIAPPVNPIVGDIIQQTNTSVNLIIVGP